jgi:hypothetical protein
VASQPKGRFSDRARQILKDAADLAAREILPIQKARILDAARDRVRKMHPEMFRKE